jgi:predicted DNA-binding transcriptional regulator AlpA
MKSLKNTSKSNKYIQIGELSELTGATTATINFYIRSGLLPPPKKINKTRALYKKSYVKKIKEIKTLQSEGLTLKGIKQFFDGTGNINITTSNQYKTDQKKTLKSSYTIDEFIEVIGVTKSTYHSLVTLNLLNKPIISSNGFHVHSRRDVIIGKAYTRLINYGVSAKFLSRHHLYNELSLSEARFLKEHLAESNDPSDPDINQSIIASFDLVRRYMRSNELENLNRKNQRSN